MANIGSKQIGGAYPIDPSWRHYIPSLFRPFDASHGRRALILDPFFNEGDQAIQIASELNLEVFGIELQDKFIPKARENMAKFYTDRGMEDYSLTRLLNDDSYAVEMSNGGFSIVYLNSPYDDLIVGSNHETENSLGGYGLKQRYELTSLKHFVKYIAPNGYVVAVMYSQHMTRKMYAEFHKNFDKIRVFRMPGEHLEHYAQVVIVGQYVKGHQKHLEDSPEAMEAAAKFIRMGQHPETIPDFEAVYQFLKKNNAYLYDSIPALNVFRGNVHFQGKKMDAAFYEARLKQVQRFGAHTLNAFKEAVRPTMQPALEQPLHKPNKRQMVVYIASGMLDNLLLERNGKKALLRGSVRELYEQIGTETEMITDKGGTFKRVHETTMIRPDHHIILLYEDGLVEDLNGADKLKSLIEDNSQLLITHFAQRYKPFYDMHIHPVWDKLLGNIHPGGNPRAKFFKSQRYVATCTIEHMAIRGKQITNGMMGVGKTPLSGATIIGLRLLDLALKHYHDASRHPALPKLAERFGITGEELDNLIVNMCQRYQIKPNEITGLPVNAPVIVAVPPIAPRVWMDQEIDPIYSGFRTRQIFTSTDVNEFMNTTLQNEDGEIIHLGVISYEAAKSNEGREPAAAYRYNRQRQYESDENDRPILRIVQNKKPIDPITGEIIKDNKGEDVPWARFTKEKRGKELMNYTGQEFYGYMSEMVTLPNGNKELQRTNKKRHSKIIHHKLDRNLQEINQAAGWPIYVSRQYPLYSEIRTQGKPKVGNGRVDTPMIEKSHPGRTIIQCRYRDKDGYPLKQPILEEVRIKPYITLVPDYNKQINLITSEPILDPWLSSMGTRFREQTGKNDSVDKMMRKAGLTYYRAGNGNALLDKELTKRGISHYQIGVGQIGIRNPKFPVAEYIRRFYTGKVGLFIADELHSFKNNTTEVAAAFRNLTYASVKVLGLTGTLYGGMSSSVFSLAYAFDPNTRKDYRWTRGAPTKWIEDMGVRKMVETRDIGGGNSSLRSGRRSAPRITEAPGASPKLMRVLAPYCLWFALADMSSHMPDKEELSYEIEFDDDQKSVYGSVLETLRAYNATCIVTGDRSFLAPYYQNMICLPDAMHRPWTVVHNIRGDKGAARKKAAEIRPEIVVNIPSLGPGIKAKERAALEWLKKDLADGRRVIIAMNQTEGRDIRDRWFQLISENVPQAKPFILKSTTPKVSERSGYIKKMSADGYNVMITNGGLITVAISINNFSVWYSIEYNASLYTFAQSTARINRPNQEERKIIYRHFYYDDKFQKHAIQHIADKVKAAAVLSGTEGGDLASLMSSEDRVQSYGEFLDAIEQGQKKLKSAAEIQEAFNAATFNSDQWRDSAWVTEADLLEIESEDADQYYAESAVAVEEDGEDNSQNDSEVAELDLFEEIGG